MRWYPLLLIIRIYIYKGKNVNGDLTGPTCYKNGHDSIRTLNLLILKLIILIQSEKFYDASYIIVLSILPTDVLKRKRDQLEFRNCKLEKAMRKNRMG